MNKTLLIIVVAVALLIVGTFAFLLSSETPDYLPGNSPDVVAHNYLFALHNEDYERAFSYLSDKLASPPADAFEFKRNVENQYRGFYGAQSTTLDIGSVEIKGNMAYVEVLETSFNQGILPEFSSYSNTFDLILTLDSGDWKISSGDFYFAWCWNLDNGC